MCASVEWVCGVQLPQPLALQAVQCRTAAEAAPGLLGRWRGLTSVWHAASLCAPFISPPLLLGPGALTAATSLAGWAGGWVGVLPLLVDCSLCSGFECSSIKSRAWHAFVVRVFVCMPWSAFLQARSHTSATQRGCKCLHSSAAPCHTLRMFGAMYALALLGLCVHACFLGQQQFPCLSQPFLMQAGAAASSAAACCAVLWPPTCCKEPGMARTQAFLIFARTFGYSC